MGDRSHEPEGNQNPYGRRTAKHWHEEKKEQQEKRRRYENDIKETRQHEKDMYQEKVYQKQRNEGPRLKKHKQHEQHEQDKLERERQLQDWDNLAEVEERLNQQQCGNEQDIHKKEETQQLAHMQEQWKEQQQVEKKYNDQLVDGGPYGPDDNERNSAGGDSTSMYRGNRSTSRYRGNRSTSRYRGNRRYRGYTPVAEHNLLVHGKQFVAPNKL
tara:strand:+ start:13042 stop:13683 length:642 start_codon:yes stop_codon:yes gene_type:complete